MMFWFLNFKHNFSYDRRLGDREDEVSEFLKDFFGSMMRTLSVETVIILKLQVDNRSITP